MIHSFFGEETVITWCGWSYRYRACYKYTIVDGTCQLETDEFISRIVTVLDVMSVPNTGGQIIIVDAPTEADTLYPSDTICYYIIGNK